MQKRLIRFVIPVLVLVVVVIGIHFGKCFLPAETISLENIPVFSGEPYVVIDDNEPDFSDARFDNKAYEHYSELDALGRCGYAIACIGKELMPTEDRGSIGQIKPSGWQTVKYYFVDGKFLYNRCHLIGFQLTGENANEKNLITGTRYLNIEGMLPFENMTADYIKETGNHVLYRATPIFQGAELVARGVQIEAKSIEDNGEGICFNVYVYNNQPGVEIDYITGVSRESGQIDTETTESKHPVYILNISSRKFHDAACKQGQNIKSENRKEYTGSREALISDGYSPAGCCKP